MVGFEMALHPQFQIALYLCFEVALHSLFESVHAESINLCVNYLYSILLITCKKISPLAIVLSFVTISSFFSSKVSKVYSTVNVCKFGSDLHVDELTLSIQMPRSCMVW